MLTDKEKQIASSAFDAAYNANKYTRIIDGTYAAVEAVLALRTDGVTEAGSEKALFRANLSFAAEREKRLAVEEALLDCAEHLEMALGRLGCPVESNDGGGAGHHDADSFGGVNALRRAREALALRTEPAPAQDRCVCCGHTYSDHTGTVPTGSTDTPCIRCECSNFIAPMRPEALTDWASFNIDDPTPAQAVPQSAGAQDVVERMLEAAEMGHLELGEKRMTAALIEARRGHHSEAEIEKALRAHWDGPGDYDSADTFVQEILARLSPHKEERVRVVGAVVYLDGLEFAAFKGHDSHEHAERYATVLRAEIREGKL